MDVFYKPPIQDHIECQALEQNYMSCMMQKALKDNTMGQRCKLDSILWFHLECPLYVEKFDNPNFMRRRFKEFFDDLVGQKLVSKIE